MEDAIISLAKTSADSSKGDELLYISNYEAPIKRKDIFENKVVRLRNVIAEREEFQKQVERIVNKLKALIAKEKSSKKVKYQGIRTNIISGGIEQVDLKKISPYAMVYQKRGK